ncbi:MAG: UDP-N-acetylglucosamine 1-carboxyvinyltransferase [Chitinivibrionales bacterium]|nr:UDP-N-acetylglucosamine 1-carboxyvinyltransferase [Chitinivibrionales bacterium]
MSSFIVAGKKRLHGSIAVSGNKNEALPLVAAALLCSESVTIRNVPHIGDVKGMLQIAEQLGASVASTDSSVIMTAATLNTSLLPLELSNRIRGSILFASSLLVRTGEARLPQPGGDAIGRRRLDTHFLVFQALGCTVEVIRESLDSGGESLMYVLSAPRGLIGSTIYLDEASVTATENALIAAAGAMGVTRIINAASEPHVQGLCRFLQTIGVTIEGVGSNVLTIHGIKKFEGCEHTLGCDYIEAGSLIGLAAATHSDLTITNVDVQHLRMIAFQYARIGIEVVCDSINHTLHIGQRQELAVKKDMGGAIPRIEDSPWPGFPADLTSIILVTATQAHGTCLIHEKMFESRLFFVDKLISMGAQIVLCDPHRAVVVGPSPLYGATLTSPDIRAGMALLIAALAAEGTSTINNIEQIDRGYENIDCRLNALGAHIERLPEKKQPK